MADNVDGKRYAIVVGQLALGEQVFTLSHSHLGQHPELDEDPELLKRALARIVLTPEKFERGGWLMFEVNFDEPVGKGSVVERREGDVYIWAVPKRRDMYRVYVTNREPEPCDTVSVIIRWRQEFQGYELRTAFVGCLPALYEADKIKNVYLRRYKFWSRYVLVYPGDKYITSGTKTDRKPASLELFTPDYSP